MWQESKHPRDELGRFTDKEKAGKLLGVNLNVDETDNFFEDRKNQQFWSIKENKENMLNKYKPFYEKYQKGIANKDNFFINTIAVFNETKRPRGKKPDYVSYNRDGEISSEYWFTDDGVIRGSNHWGTNVSSCSWYLGDQKTSMHDKKQYGFCKWKDFTQKTDIVEHKGKYVLSNFDNTIGTYYDGYNKIPIIKGFNEKWWENIK